MEDVFRPQNLRISSWAAGQAMKHTVTNIPQPYGLSLHPGDGREGVVFGVGHEVATESSRATPPPGGHQRPRHLEERAKRP